MVKQLISKINVEGLFGLYNYQLPEKGSFSNAVILYGDNGSGKTTILRLAFHLLSAAGDKGHRNTLTLIQFTSLTVELDSGIILSAKRLNPDAPQTITLAILDKKNLIAEWTYTHGQKHDEGDITQLFIDWEGKREIKQVIRVSSKTKDIPKGRAAYLSALAKYAPAVFLLDSERYLASDLNPDDEETEVRRILRHEHILKDKGRLREIARFKCGCKGNK
jgi:hypothetical protein